jgi:hypothetical protein
MEAEIFLDIRTLVGSRHFECLGHEQSPGIG